MIVLAGPIASGKTTRFRELQQRLRIDTFNVDDRSALCRARHNPHYAERRIMPTRHATQAVSAVVSARHAA